MIEQLKPIDLGILIAAVVMALGAFCPIVSLPIVGSFNYVMRGNGDGILVVGCSVAIIALTIFGYRRTSGLVAAAALAMMIVTIARMADALGKIQADAAHSAKSRAFGGIASLMANSIGLSWGWVLLVGGAVAVLILALLAPQARTPLESTQTAIEPASEPFSSADKLIAEYLNKRSDPPIPNAGQRPSFGKR